VGLIVDTPLRDAVSGAKNPRRIEKVLSILWETLVAKGAIRGNISLVI
jgi:hypothetical protein